MFVSKVQSLKPVSLYVSVRIPIKQPVSRSYCAVLAVRALSLLPVIRERTQAESGHSDGPTHQPQHGAGGAGGGGAGGGGGGGDGGREGGGGVSHY